MAAAQAGEQQVRPGRAGTELRVRLGGHEVGMHVLGQFHELHQASIWGRPAEDQTRFRQRLTVGVVHLVAMTMALVDGKFTVGVGHDAAGSQPRGASPAAWSRPCLVRR